MPKLTKAALQRKKPVTDEVLIPADDAQAVRFAEAQQGLANATQRQNLAQITGDEESLASAKEALAAAEAEIAACKEAIRKQGTCFTLVAVGRVRWDELLVEHPPTPEQAAEDADKPDDQKRAFNPKTFWPALLSETVPDSDLTAEEWRKLVFESKDWGPAELAEIRDRASAVNQGSRILPLGN